MQNPCSLNDTVLPNYVIQMFEATNLSQKQVSGVAKAAISSA